MRRHHQLFAFILALAASPTMLWANTEPTVEIKSAAMRPGTTLMDIVFRVNDPDDNTVKTRALAFKDGARSFSHVIKPTTFVEGTGSKFGDAIAANTDHTVTWDVAADWNIDLGQVKFEVLAMDNRGLLPFEWIGIPATSQNAAVTISKNSPSSDDVLDAFFWLYAGDDPDLVLQGSALRGASSAGVFSGLTLVDGSGLGNYAIPFIFKEMNLAEATPTEVSIATSARAGQANGYLAAKRNYDGVSPILGWGGGNGGGQTGIPFGLSDVTAIAAGDQHCLALSSNGRVVGWGQVWGGAATPPAGLRGVVAIAAGMDHSLALKSDGTVVGWGHARGSATAPAGLNGVVAIAAGRDHSLALKSDGTVVGWGRWWSDMPGPPADLSGVAAIAARGNHGIALMSDGRIRSWGQGASGAPAEVVGATAIAAGDYHGLALKRDGTVVGWGQNWAGAATPPEGLSGVVAIAAGAYHSMALKSNGTVVCWGYNSQGETDTPAGLTGVTAISAGEYFSLALKGKSL